MLLLLLQAYSKSGLISTQEDKHSGDTFLTAVNRNHPLLSDFRPYKTKASSSSNSAANGSSAAASGQAGSAAAGDGSDIAPLVVEEVFKPSKDVKGEPHPQQQCLIDTKAM
jgi:hypothetical protein